MVCVCTLIAIAAIVAVLYFFGKDLRHRFFAALMQKLSQKKDPKYEEIKKDLFKPLHSQVSAHPELRAKKKLRVLEIGVGTGVNFEYYPDGTHLTVIDPNPHFAKYYDANRSKFKNIESEEILVCGGEDMDAIESNSVDAVVMTLVMCSTSDNDKILRQIHRVLVPGGKFYHLEHIREFESSKHWIREGLQRVLSTTRVWPFFFDGCYLDRDPLPLIKSVGFANVDSKKIHAPIPYKFFQIISPHLVGVATK